MARHRGRHGVARPSFISVFCVEVPSRPESVLVNLGTHVCVEAAMRSELSARVITHRTVRTAVVTIQVDVLVTLSVSPAKAALESPRS